MIDLGIKPSSKECVTTVESGPKDKPHYPCLYFSHEEKLDIPESGEAVIKFRRIEMAENTRDEDSPKYRYELEVQGIEPKGGKKADLASALRKSMQKAKGNGEEY